MTRTEVDTKLGENQLPVIDKVDFSCLDSDYSEGFYFLGDKDHIRRIGQHYYLEIKPFNSHAVQIAHRLITAERQHFIFFPESPKVLTDQLEERDPATNAALRSLYLIYPRDPRVDPKEVLSHPIGTFQLLTSNRPVAWRDLTHFALAKQVQRPMEETRPPDAPYGIGRQVLEAIQVLVFEQSLTPDGRASMGFRLRVLADIKGYERMAHLALNTGMIPSYTQPNGRSSEDIDNYVQHGGYKIVGVYNTEGARIGWRRGFEFTTSREAFGAFRAGSKLPTIADTPYIPALYDPDSDLSLERLVRANTSKQSPW